MSINYKIMSAATSTRKILIAANWKSQGTMGAVTNLVNNVLNKILYDPKKLGLL